jgi:hypothetical protein
VRRSLLVAIVNILTVRSLAATTLFSITSLLAVVDPATVRDFLLRHVRLCNGHDKGSIYIVYFCSLKRVLYMNEEPTYISFYAKVFVADELLPS